MDHNGKIILVVINLTSSQINSGQYRNARLTLSTQLYSSTSVDDSDKETNTKQRQKPHHLVKEKTHSNEF